MLLLLCWLCVQLPQLWRTAMVSHLFTSQLNINQALSPCCKPRIQKQLPWWTTRDKRL